MGRQRRREPVLIENVEIIDTANKGKSVAKISNIRDKYLVELQKLRKEYEKQIRN